jgi:hypothetical protein
VTQSRLSAFESLGQGPAHYHSIRYPDGTWGRTQKDWLTGLGVAGPYVKLGQIPEGGPEFNLKRDLIAGGAALALPLAYDKLAPKKWPKLNLLSSIGVSIVTYFAVATVFGMAT